MAICIVQSQISVASCEEAGLIMSSQVMWIILQPSPAQPSYFSLFWYIWKLCTGEENRVKLCIAGSIELELEIYEWCWIQGKLQWPLAQTWQLVFAGSKYCPEYGVVRIHTCMYALSPRFWVLNPVLNVWLGSYLSPSWWYNGYTTSRVLNCCGETVEVQVLLRGIKAHTTSEKAISQKLREIFTPNPQQC